MIFPSSQRPRWEFLIYRSAVFLKNSPNLTQIPNQEYNINSNYNKGVNHERTQSHILRESRTNPRYYL